MRDTVLITGGSGLLALNWAMAIRERYSVILGLYDRNITLSGVESSPINLESVSDLTKAFNSFRPGVVIHTAGLTSVEACEANPELALHVNSGLSNNVAMVCAKLGIKMVHISTDHLFSGKDPLVTEDSPVNPKNVYGRSKAEAEARVIQACPEALIVRTNFYGWGPSYRSSFSDTIINALRSGKEINLFQDVFYTPLLAEKVALNTHELINAKVSGIFNVVGDERISKYEFGLKVARRFKLNFDLIRPVLLGDKPELVQRPNDLSLSNRKTSDLIGRKPGHIDEDIDRLYEQEQLGLANEIRNL